MKISRNGQIVVVADGAFARYGVGALLPAFLVGSFLLLAFPERFRLWQTAVAFAVTAVAIAVLKPPRRSEFDLERREVRLTIGWPPMFGRLSTFPFETIREAKVHQFIRLGDDLGSARPALVLRSRRTVFLSTYNRSPKQCRNIVEQVRSLLSRPPIPI